MRSRPAVWVRPTSNWGPDRRVRSTPACALRVTSDTEATGKGTEAADPTTNAEAATNADAAYSVTNAHAAYSADPITNS